jgi:hypothetical protein
MFIHMDMSPKELTAFRVEADIMEGLRRLKERDGVPLSVQVDRALRAWLGEKGVTLKKASKTNRRAPIRATRRRRA